MPRFVVVVQQHFTETHTILRVLAWKPRVSVCQSKSTASVGSRVPGAVSLAVVKNVEYSPEAAIMPGVRALGLSVERTTQKASLVS